MSDELKFISMKLMAILRLGCEPEAFAPYRNIVEDQLQDFQKLPSAKS